MVRTRRSARRQGKGRGKGVEPRESEEGVGSGAQARTTSPCPGSDRHGDGGRRRAWAALRVGYCAVWGVYVRATAMDAPTRFCDCAGLRLANYFLAQSAYRCCSAVAYLAPDAIQTLRGVYPRAQ